MLKRLLVMLAPLVLGGCNNIVQSYNCNGSFVCAPPQASAEGRQPYQTYALPMTIVDFTLTKPASGPLALTATPRNVADPDPFYWYRLAYDPHAGADDELALTVSNGLLHTADAQSSTQLPDVVELVSPVLRGIGLMGASPIGTNRGEHRADNPGAQQAAILGKGPDDTFEIKIYTTSVSCDIERLVAGVPAVTAARPDTPLLPTDQIVLPTNDTCTTQVGARYRTVRLDCADTPAGWMDLNALSLLFGPVTRTSACGNNNQGVFAFEYVDATVHLVIGADPRAAPRLHEFWTTASIDGHRPYDASDCRADDEGVDASCFPQGETGSVFYRATAPFQARGVACARNMELNNDQPPRQASDCLALPESQLSYLGETQRFAAVVRRPAFALDLPRGVGADHRKYAFTNGVLEGVEIERTGMLLSTLRLPLTLFGIGDD